ncbi:hypothetical protein GCM10010440_68950 [Kitasatospora cinereorecta]
MRPIHQMRLTGRLGSGADEWSCPACGRRIALRRPPHPEITVLDPGDEGAVHIGVLEPDSAAAAAAAEKYGVGPIQEIPRPPRTAGSRRRDRAAAAEAGAGSDSEATGSDAEPDAEPDAADRRWLAEIGIDWDGDEAA